MATPLRLIPLGDLLLHKPHELQRIPDHQTHGLRVLFLWQQLPEVRALPNLPHSRLGSFACELPLHLLVALQLYQVVVIENHQAFEGGHEGQLAGESLGGNGRREVTMSGQSQQIFNGPLAQPLAVLQKEANAPLGSCPQLALGGLGQLGYRCGVIVAYRGTVGDALGGAFGGALAGSLAGGALVGIPGGLGFAPVPGRRQIAGGTVCSGRATSGIPAG